MKLANLKAAFLAVVALVLAGVIAVGEFVRAGFSVGFLPTIRQAKPVIAALVIAITIPLSACGATSPIWGVGFDEWPITPETKLQAKLAAGADPNAKSELTGESAIGRAAQHGYVNLVKDLIAAGADVNAEDDYGGTPLHDAAYKGQAEVISILIKAGADVNAKTDGGSTPLHSAAYKGQAEVIPILIKAGADVHAKNNDGSTPLANAIKEGHSNAAAALKKGGADTAGIERQVAKAKAAEAQRKAEAAAAAKQSGQTLEQEMNALIGGALALGGIASGDDTLAQIGSGIMSGNSALDSITGSNTLNENETDASGRSVGSAGFEDEAQKMHQCTDNHRNAARIDALVASPNNEGIIKSAAKAAEASELTAAMLESCKHNMSPNNPDLARVIETISQFRLAAKQAHDVCRKASETLSRCP